MASDVSGPSAEQPRKRRRPALSCFECRHKKIKCDRNNPCSPCMKAKSSTCTYSPDAATSGPDHQSKTVVTSPAFSSMRYTGQPQSGSLPINGPSENVISHYPAPDAFPRTEGSAEGIQWTGHTASKRPASGQSDVERTIGDLKDRIKSLELMLPDPNNNRQAGPRNLSINQSAPQPSLAPECRFLGGDNTENRPSILTEAKPLRGTMMKTRLYGPGNWKTLIEQFDTIRSRFFVRNANGEKNAMSTSNVGAAGADLPKLFQKCIDLSKACKAQHQVQYNFPLDLHNSIPPQQVANNLVQCYLRTFESAYRIIHIPSFQQEYAQYWDNIQAASTGFLMKLSLVMAIGSRISQEHSGDSELRSQALRWIYNAQQWLAGPHEKGRLNLTGIQVHCLLLLARQVNAAGADLVYVSAGSLLRTAIHMGLHRDPRHLPRMPEFHKELRRRLWTTVVELALQSTLDSSLPPLMSGEDFDTESPSNIDDDEVDATSTIIPRSKRMEAFTQSSFQIILLKSLRTRLEVARIMNDFKSEPSYDDVLRLSTELAHACDEAAGLAHTYQTTNNSAHTGPTAFHCNLLQHLLQRFLIALHRPFALKARKDPRYYFSRKSCLDSCLTIISPGADEDFLTLVIKGGGLFREILGWGAAMVCLELVNQLEEQGSNRLLQRNKAIREPIREAVRNIIDLAEHRIQSGDYNIKPYLFLSMAMGQIDSMEAGDPPEYGIYPAARTSCGKCIEILQSRTNSFPAGSEPAESKNQNLENDISHTVNGQGFDLNIPQNLNFDFEIPDSWFFPSWEQDWWK